MFCERLSINGVTFELKYWNKKEHVNVNQNLHLTVYVYFTKFDIRHTCIVIHVYIILLFVIEELPGLSLAMPNKQ